MYECCTYVQDTIKKFNIYILDKEIILILIKPSKYNIKIIEHNLYKYIYIIIPQYIN